MATASIGNIDLTTLDNNAFATINYLRKQHKFVSFDKIYNELIKTINFENASREHLHDRINELIIQGKIVNKPNRNDDSYRVNESIVDFNIEQLEDSSLSGSDLSFIPPNTKQSSSIESVNTPRKPTNNILGTPNFPQKNINSKESVRRIMESQTFNDNISEKMKIESRKTGIISSLESTISSLFQKELNTMKDKCEKLIQNSYSNYICQIDNLRKEIKNKDEIINKLSTALNSITNNVILKNPTVVLNNKNLLPENAPSNDNKNILPPAGDCSIKQIVKDKEDCASVPASSTKIKKEIADYRQQKRQQFDLFQKIARSEISDENCTINEASPKETKYTWSAGTFVIVGDSIITGIDEKRLSKNRLVKVHHVRGATLADINHHIIPILKKKRNVIILHVGTNDSVSRTSHEIPDDLLQLKSAITKTLPNCQAIFSQATLRVDHGKAALTLHRLNEHFSELNFDVVNNSNIKVKHIGQKGLHLNPKADLL